MEKNQDSVSGKMSQARSVQTAGRTSKLSSKRSSASKSRGPRCLRLKITDVQKRTYIWEPDGVWLTEFLTLNFGASPSEENASSLSQILEANVPEKYYLSPKACLGILRRASERGKELPEVLRKALERQAATGKEQLTVELEE